MAHNFAIGTHVALPIVGRAVVVVVPGGIVTTVVGADVWIAKSAFCVINPQMSATIGVAKQSLWPRFVDVAARNISFCRVSRHGQNCSRHHRDNAEQGVAGLAHSPPVCGSRSPQIERARTRPGGYAATCGINKVAQCLLQLGGKPRASVVVGHEMSEGTMSDGFDDVASKGCVLVSWQPRHQQDEEAAD